MSDLPDGWEWTTLGEISESIKNGIFVSRPGAEPDGVPILRISAVRSLDLRLDDLRYTGLEPMELADRDALLAAGNLVFTRYSGSKDFVGVGAVVPNGIDDLTYPDKLIRVRVDQSLADPHFIVLAFAFAEVRARVELRLKTTAGQVGISGAALAEVELPLAPLAEQYRVVAELTALIDGMTVGEASVRQGLRRADDYDRRVVAEAVTGGGRIRDGLAEPSEPLADAGVRDGDLPRLPPGWCWKRLHEIADVVGGVTKDSVKQSDPAVPLVPYLRVANVQRGHLDLEHIAEIRVPESRVEKLLLQSGDVLLNEGGDRDKLGRGWIWEGQIDRCIHQNHVFRARIRDGVLHPKLLAWHANGFGHWFDVNGKQSVNLASISLRTIKQLPVPVPPADEQTDIVRDVEEKLAESARLRAVLQAAQAHAVSLRRSVLADAFAGRLVPQDPDDEPAGVLLERIRAERLAAPQRRSARRS